MCLVKYISLSTWALVKTPKNRSTVQVVFHGKKPVRNSFTLLKSYFYISLEKQYFQNKSKNNKNYTSVQEKLTIYKTDL